MDKIVCWVCKRELEENEEYMPYDTPAGMFYKCKGCHIEDSILRDYRPTEIYSRVCGYLRPLSQWNPGKLAEHKNKKYYANGKQ